MADLLDDLGDQKIPGAPAPAIPVPVAPAPAPVEFRRFDDIDAHRQAIYDHALAGVQKRFPIENDTHRLEVTGVGYDKPFTPTKADEKKALMSGSRFHRPLTGTVQLVDKATSQVLDQKHVTLAHIPHLNSRGLFIHNGTVWGMRNQARLRPGVYVRKQQNGGVEAHINVKPSTGRGFRLQLEPETGLMKFTVGQSSTRLYPVLKSLGVDDKAIAEAWGPELLKLNQREGSGHDLTDLRKVVDKLGRHAEKEAKDHELPQTLQGILSRSELDPDTTELTMGKRIDKLSPDILLAATRKILRVSTGQEEGDNRDSQAFQSIHSAEDLIRERLERDQIGAARKLLWRSTRSGKLDRLDPGLLTPNIHALFRGSGLAASVEDINPWETFDQRQSVTRMGEGGINSTQSVSRDARGVQPSHFGLLDPVRAPESDRVGLDLRLSDAALKGSDGQLYTTLTDAKTGKPTIMSSRMMTKKVIAFPGEMEGNRKKIRAMVGEQIKYVDRSEVDASLPNSSDLLSRASNLVPMPEGVKAQRLLMGARMLTQAMPLRDPEAPLVTSMGPDGRSYNESSGKDAGAVHADRPGVVSNITKDAIEILHDGGEKTTHQLYHNYPLARKTLLDNTPVVSIGQPVKPGDLLAHSNFTDKKGHAAPGLNLRVAYLSGRGATYEDAIVISESAAKKLSSQHQYKHQMEFGPEVHSAKTADYRQIYGDKFSKEQFDKLDDDGVVREGQILHPGDPVMVAVGKRAGRAKGALMNSPKALHTDLSQVWDHTQVGEVTDVVRTRSGVKVAIKSYEPMTIGSKLSSMYGNKGVISQCIPDDQMPHDSEGKPMEVLLSPTGIVTRVNPSVLVSSLLGKVAARTGVPYNMKSFQPHKLADFALDEAHKHGVKETETLTDPRDGRQLPNVFTGVQYLMKLHHTAESKLSARDIGGYAMDESPARGGDTGSKRVGMLDVASLLSSGATEFLKDAKLIRGQRNDEFWRKLKMGDTPEAPGESFANKHFRAQLLAAGVNLKKQPNGKTQLGYMTDKDVDQLAQHSIDHDETFDYKTMSPVAGGLFDIGKTGGAEGERFTKWNLPCKIPNPLAQEPITRILGLTGKGFEAILSGTEELNGKTGPEAIQAALAGVNLDRDIEATKAEVKSSTRSRRDAAVRKLGYLQGLKKQGIEPESLMISKVPIIPPKFRPIIRTPKLDIIHDANHLYKDMIQASKNYQDAHQEFGKAHDEYKNLYDTVKAVVGVGNPVGPKTTDMGVRGMLRFAIGMADSPKYSRFQRKVIGNSVDTVGRSVITIDPELDMDSMGMPEDMAWTQFRPWVIRSLVRQGMPATEAVKAVRSRNPAAQMALDAEMKTRPVVYNRAPSLHRYNYVGGFARINKGRSDISVPQVVTKGLGADFDGDAINVHVPVSDEAVKETIAKLFPSKNLIHPNSFDVHLEPTQEFLAGLYLASQKDHSKPPKIFATAEDAKKAYARGEIGIRDPVQILKP